MPEENLELEFNRKYLPLEYKLLEWKLMFNQELYDENIIDIEVKREMEKKLLGRMTKIRNKYSKKENLSPLFLSRDMKLF